MNAQRPGRPDERGRHLISTGAIYDASGGRATY